MRGKRDHPLDNCYYHLVFLITEIINGSRILLGESLLYNNSLRLLGSDKISREYTNNICNRKSAMNLSKPYLYKYILLISTLYSHNIITVKSAGLM